MTRGCLFVEFVFSPAWDLYQLFRNFSNIRALCCIAAIGANNKVMTFLLQIIRGIEFIVTPHLIQQQPFWQLMLYPKFYYLRETT